ncbi:hypothetical protein [Ferviditalea candida]|uniref:Uncharacterized protein n=1 Tax=Ferviditalea candida TaxID=3108399 RepID=A0ABU5ZI38_9BACL|nr:hypothetical protein [Paenibacillaceae bacterium T2]
MYKKLIGIVMAGTLLFSAASAFAEAASNPGSGTAGFGQAQDAQAWKQWRAELKQVQQSWNDIVIQEAQKLGIATEGKSAKELRQAIRDYWQSKRMNALQAQAEKLGIDTAGKTFDQLKSEVKAKLQEKLYAKASQLGINTDGMTVEQVRAAVKQALESQRIDRLNKAAAKLGIDTTGKTPEQIRLEIKNAVISKLKERLNKLEQSESGA